MIDKVKLGYYGLLAVQFLFFMWLFSSMVVDGRFTEQKFSGNILIFKIIPAWAVVIGAIYLRIIQLQSITRN